MADETFTTAILRFRDLNVPLGRTIEVHRADSDRSGGTWWAWWRKGDEAVPDSAFRQINLAAREPGGLKLYLYDSGRNLTYRATCVQSRRDPMHEDIAPPDPASTPAHYGDSKVRAWFNFSSIEEVPAVDGNADRRRSGATGW